MATRMVEHRGVIRRIEAGQAIVVMETAGCASCHQGSACGVGKMAAGRPATQLSIPVAEPLACQLKPGDYVVLGLPESRLSLSALLGYLFPAFAMLFGAGLATEISPHDGATALGAIVGFLSALLIARGVLHFLPHWMPAPQLLDFSTPVGMEGRVMDSYVKEFHHE